MSEKNYPEEIYPGEMNIFGAKARRTPNIFDVEHAYDIGVAHGKAYAEKESDPLAGFSNLTQAIKDGIKIDWEQLDGRKARCMHPKLNGAEYHLTRDKSCPIDTPAGWYVWSELESNLWADSLTQSWLGKQDWSLWIEGEIPVKTHAADELEPGICFYGKLQGVTGAFFIFLNNAGTKRAYSFIHRDIYEPEKVEVLEIYGIGTLQPSNKEGN